MLAPCIRLSGRFVQNAAMPYPAVLVGANLFAQRGLVERVNSPPLAMVQGASPGLRWRLSGYVDSFAHGAQAFLSILYALFPFSASLIVAFV
jgi:hypothetical protein